MSATPQVLHVIAASVSPHADGRALLVRLSEGGVARLVFSENLSAQIAAELGWRAPAASAIKHKHSDKMAERRAATDARFSPILATLEADAALSVDTACARAGELPGSFRQWLSSRGRRVPARASRARDESYVARSAASAARFQPVLTALADPANAGKSVSAVCRSLGIAPMSFLNWRAYWARRAKQGAAA